MPLLYTQKLKTVQINAFIKECVNWFLDTHESKSVSLPPLPEFLEKNHQLSEGYRALNDVSDAEPGEISKLFESFIARLFSLYDEATNYDQRTGLKSEQAILSDMALEQERLVRGGLRFSIALLRVDGFSKIKSEKNKEQIAAIYDYISSLIKNSLRLFDDAYIRENSDFVLSLKQTHKDGGFSALERITESIESREFTYTIDGKTHNLSMSCCVYDPLAEDDIAILLKNMSESLDEDQSSPGRLFTYKEISPLLRYTKQKD